MFLVLRSFWAAVCSDAGSLASDEVVTIRNNYPLGGCWLPTTAVQKKGHRKNEDTATPYSSWMDIRGMWYNITSNPSYLSTLNVLFKRSTGSFSSLYRQLKRQYCKIAFWLTEVSISGGKGIEIRNIPCQYLLTYLNSILFNKNSRCKFHNLFSIVFFESGISFLWGLLYCDLGMLGQIERGRVL